MDPNANLEEQRKLAHRLLNKEELPDYDIATLGLRLAELVLALDEWLYKGGFYPKRWKENRP